MNLSLRARLLLGTTITTTLILGLLGFAIFTSMQRSLVAGMDKLLLEKARALSAMTEQNGKRVKMEWDRSQMPEFGKVARPEYFEMRLDSGQTLSQSDSLEKGSTLGHDLPVDTSYQNIILPDSRHGRMVAMTFTPLIDHQEDEGKPGRTIHKVTLALARDTADLDTTLAKLRWLLIGLCGLAILVCDLALLFIVSRATRPVLQLARQIESLHETQLDKRLSAHAAPRELLPVIERLNGLLARLEEAFAREKGITADVAHELRTPLAGLYTTLQVCRSRSRDSAAYEAAIDKSLKISSGMRTLVETLLMLARADAGQLAMRTEQTDVTAVLSECFADQQSRVTARGLNVTLNLDDNCQVQSDREKLRIILSNLLDNALAYVDECGQLHIEARRIDQTIRVRITNTGCLLSQRQAEQVFDRFWRGDVARSDTGHHCGLGLALCKRLTTLLGGQIAAQVESGRFIVTLTLAAQEGHVARSPQLQPVGTTA